MSSQPRTAIVTGASQGIGAGIVKAFVERGFNVVANSLKVTKSTEVAVSSHFWNSPLIKGVSFRTFCAIGQTNHKLGGHLPGDTIMNCTAKFIVALSLLAATAWGLGLTNSV